MGNIEKEISRKVKIRVIERTSSGTRFLDLKGNILKTKDQYIYIGNYIIDMDNIIKMVYI